MNFFYGNIIHLVGLIHQKPIFVFCVLIFLTSCDDQSDKPKISEGEIEYSIEYLDSERENPFVMLLPRKMITSFRKNSSRTMIEGFFGTFKLSYVLNPTHQENYSLLQIMDRKYVYQADINNLAFGYENMQNIEIHCTDKHAMIAGYRCDHAYAVIPGTQCDSIDVYYTNEIDLKKPNQNNPFREIDGVLMAFTIQLMGINMKVTTKEITPKNVKPELFEIPEGYTKISLNEMENIVKEFNVSSNK